MTGRLRIRTAELGVVDSADDIGDTLHELVDLDVLGQDLEQVVADIVLAGGVDQALSWIDIGLVRRCKGLVVGGILFGALALSESVHLLGVHVERRVVADNLQNTRQVDELERLGGSDIDKLAPVVKRSIFAFVRHVEDVILLFDGLDFTHLLKFLKQIKEDFLIEEKFHLQIVRLLTHLVSLAALQGGQVDWERVVDKNLFDR